MTSLTTTTTRWDKHIQEYRSISTSTYKVRRPIVNTVFIKFNQPFNTERIIIETATTTITTTTRTGTNFCTLYLPILFLYNAYSFD